MQASTHYTTQPPHQDNYYGRSSEALQQYTGVSSQNNT